MTLVVLIQVLLKVFELMVLIIGNGCLEICHVTVSVTMTGFVLQQYFM